MMVDTGGGGGGGGSALVKNLQYLDLSSNQLEWVPSGVFELEALRTLNLSHNKIKDLVWQSEEDLQKEEEDLQKEEDDGNKAFWVAEPVSSRGWKHGLVELIQLDLSNNQIDNLGYMPMAISGCKSLRTLHLNNNNLEEIPLELGLLKQLTTITLSGNPQKGIRQDILSSQSCEHILEYLHDKMDPTEVKRVEKQHRAIEVALTGASSSTTQEEERQQSADSVDQGERRKQLEESVKELMIKIDDGNAQLEKISISAAKRKEIKKDLAVHRAKLNREEKLMMAEAAQ